MQGGKKQKRCVLRQRLAFGMDVGAEKQKVQSTKLERRLFGKNFRIVQRIQLAACAKHAGGFDGRRRDEASGKNEPHEKDDEENGIKRKSGLDADNKLSVAALLVADCEQAWLHPVEAKPSLNGTFGGEN